MNELLFPLHGKECFHSGPGFTADELPDAEREGEEEERSRAAASSLPNTALVVPCCPCTY